MFASKLNIRVLWWATEVLLLLGVVAASVIFAQPGEWHPATLAILVLAVAVAGEWFTVETTHAYLSASLGAMVLAMGVLGPAVGAAAGTGAMVTHCWRRRRPPLAWINNLTGYAVAPYAGGWVVRELSDQFAIAPRPDPAQSIVLGLIVLTGVVVLLVVNFSLFALDLRITKRQPILPLIRELFFPMLPADLAIGLIASLLLVCYRAVGMPVLVAAIPVLIIFYYLGTALVRSERRAEQLQARARQLASFQITVPQVLMGALGMRDPGALRHAAAVASYAKALATQLDCSPADIEVIHLTGLLHDIGKFTWSDRLLTSRELTDADFDVIRRHPSDGAELIGKVDGFGPVADGILYHHERTDGTGYPAGLIATEIPLASRIVAVCSTYDTMTATETFAPRLAPEEAIAELRNIAGRQLDADLVEAFVEVLHREGMTFAMNADYKTELAFDRRVSLMAEPRDEDGGAERSASEALATVRALGERVLNRR